MIEIKATQLPRGAQAKIEFPIWLSWVTGGPTTTVGEMLQVLIPSAGDSDPGHRKQPLRAASCRGGTPESQGPGLHLLAAEIWETER